MASDSSSNEEIPCGTKFTDIVIRLNRCDVDAFDNEQCSSKDVVGSDVGNVAATQTIGICIDSDNRDVETTSSTTFTDTAIQLRTCDVNGVANEQCNSNDAANIDNDNVVIGNDMQTCE